MDNKSIREVYLKRKSYHSLEVDDTDIQWQYLIKYIPEDRTIPVLDAGCGNGKRALKLFNRNYSKICAIDLFDSIPVKEINYQKASIEDIPFNNGTFRFIYAMSVIYYPKDTEKAIREFARVLQTGGILLMTAHTKYSLFTLRRIILRWLGRRSMVHLKDVRFKSAGEYIRLLRSNGFEPELVDGFNLSFVFVPVYNFIRQIVTKYLKIRLPAPTAKITRNKFLARLKSIFAYHMVIVARKTDAV